MKFKLTAFCLISAFTAFAQASAQKELIAKLNQELPPREAPYVGKINGKPCQVEVKGSEDMYTVTVQLANGQKGSFYIDTQSALTEVWGFEEKKNIEPYAGEAHREYRTSVQLTTGKTLSYEELYGTFAEKTFMFQIKDVSTKRIPRWKIYTGVSNALSIGFGMRTCELDLQ